MSAIPIRCAAGPTASPMSGRASSTCSIARANVPPRFMILSASRPGRPGGRPTLRALRQFIERVIAQNDVQFARCA